MSNTNAKSLVIAALVLVNVFFLTIIVSETVGVARYERREIENICAVVRNNGIAIDTENVSVGGVFSTMRTVRVSDRELAIARAVLGDAEMTDQGVIVLYENAERGAAEFYSGCDFKISVNDGVVSGSNGAARVAGKLLRDMKLDTSEVFVSGETGNETVTAVSAYKGVSIFNCTIEFDFSGGYLRTVTGRYVAGVEAVGGGLKISSVGTALMAFVSAVNRGDIECGRIISVEPGYIQNVVGAFGDGAITPAWSIITDEARYVIDDTDGEIRQLTFFST